MGTDDMAAIAGLIGRALRGRGDDEALASVRGEVLALCRSFPPYPQLVGERAPASGAGSGGGG